MKCSTVLLFLAAMLTGTAQAQNWTAFVPAERDFRVLFPSPPVRFNEADGSTGFRSRFEHRDYSLDYVVYRLPPGIKPVGNARAVIEQRIQARLRNKNVEVQYLRDDGDTPGWDRQVFRRGPVLSVHRLVAHQGRFYELEVAMPRGAQRRATHTARDFFSSFQVTGVGLPSVTIVVQHIETWCKDRTDGFSQAFCRYSVCLQPGYEKHAHCTALLGR